MNTNGMTRDICVNWYPKKYKSMGLELVKEIKEYVKNGTAPYKYPRVVEFVDELPKTISGKIRKVELRQ